MRLLKGTELCYEDQRRALNQYTNRYTGNHRPSWSLRPMPNGNPYPLQFANDNDWLAHTDFYVTKNNRLDKRANSCWSNPTWPNNPELRRPA